MSTEPGALVNVTIKNVRMGERSHLRVTVEDGVGDVWVLPPHAEIEHVAPAHWPPQIGDLWRDGHGNLLFTLRDRHGNPLMDSVDGGRHSPDYVLRQHGPLALVHREEPGS